MNNTTRPTPQRDRGGKQKSAPRKKADKRKVARLPLVCSCINGAAG